MMFIIQSNVNRDMRAIRTMTHKGFNRIINAVRYHFSQKQPASELYNPYTKQLVSSKHYLQDDEVFTKLTTATQAFSRWKHTDLDTRVNLVKQFTESLLADREILKPIISAEIGKSYLNIDQQFRRIGQLTGSFIEEGRTLLKSQVIEEQPHKIKKVVYEPIGLSLIFPYFSEPLFDSIINLIPCLIAGNGALLKPSDFNHFLGPYLEQKANRIFKMQGLITQVFIAPQKLPLLAQFRSLKKVLYSGSVESAKHIFQTLIRKRFIDCNLFFGGRDAAYVDHTADLHLAARQIVANAFYNNGQSYDCIKRVYIDEQVQSQLLELLREQISKITFGDPRASLLGPLCVPENASLAEKYINDSISSGASCLIGGLTASEGEGAGAFLEPTLLSNCTNDMIVVQAQTLAPVLCTISTTRAGVAQEINQSDFGTGVRIFTGRPSEYKEMIDELQVGKVSFNSGRLFSDNLPIEGWKSSGKGKILSGLSYQEFSIPKSYNIKQL